MVTPSDLKFRTVTIISHEASLGFRGRVWPGKSDTASNPVDRVRYSPQGVGDGVV